MLLLHAPLQAVKCTPEGGAITLRLDFAPGEQPRLVLSVRDTGIGLAAEQIEAVFQPFVQAEADTHTHYGGTGLGLAVRVALRYWVLSTTRII